MKSIIRVGRCAFALVLLSAAEFTWAEPYIAVQTGLKCVHCHVNPTGGGLRNEFGNAYSYTQLPADRIETPAPWLGKLSDMILLGADLRADLTLTNTPNQPRTQAFDVSQARVYAEVNLIPKRLGVYVDQLVSPGSFNREAYMHYGSAGGGMYVKAGRLYLPFGLRIQDDLAFTRQVPGINMTTPDSGIELGSEHGPWSTQFALSNGTGGGSENDTGKQYSLQGTYTQSRWRLGTGVNFNDSDAGDRSAVALFAGLRTGPFSWLAEIDYVVDRNAIEGSQTDATRHLRRTVGLIEANWLLRQGHNLKLTGESYDPNRDIDEDDQTRLSVVYEYAPIQFLQVRAGVRYYNGIPQNDLQNRRVSFIELHGFH
jgi:hypothetical protein